MRLQQLIPRYRAAFEQRYGHRTTAQQRAALSAIVDCRSERYGKLQLHCQGCQLDQFAYQSCGHRSCPGCHHHDTVQWLARQQQKLLPVNYFMVTFTLPAQLRPLVWSEQKDLYALLFQCASATLKRFANNHKQLSGDLGMTAVLHTHSRKLDYHPHVHLVVPAIALSPQRRQWKKLRGRYLFKANALANVFRGKFLEGLSALGLRQPPNTPAQWVAHCKHVGRGLPALKYLSRYLYRGVISEKNILDDDGENIRFRYTDSDTGKSVVRTVAGETFLWLISQHALPKGFRRVRDYGILHGNAKKTRYLLQSALSVRLPVSETSARPAWPCRHCGHDLRVRAFIPPPWRTG
jgi:hypothetical protein|tara:strand:- start:252 stop:1301 length:1050 start_codon:yes stop_codon:yes gene_type:complete